MAADSEASRLAEPAEPIERAFRGNRLLATFDDEARALIEPHCERVEMIAGEVVFRAGHEVTESFFPFDGLIVSLVVDLAEGRGVEVASIGNEGAVGGIVSCGTAPAFSRATVQMPGPALRVSMKSLEQAKARSAFLRNLFCRYSDYLLSQVMQSVACNAFHPIEARAARWLLSAQDRVGGDRLPLTQDALSRLLGVQRTSVNAALGALHEIGVIANRHGAIEVRDRIGLEFQACECYARVEQHFADILGPSGRGGVA